MYISGASGGGAERVRMPLSLGCTHMAVDQASVWFFMQDDTLLAITTTALEAQAPSHKIFPGCVGFLDDTEKQPKYDHETYFSRKKIYSGPNLQAISDSSRRPTSML